MCETLFQPPYSIVPLLRGLVSLLMLMALLSPILYLIYSKFFSPTKEVNSKRFVKVTIVAIVIALAAIFVNTFLLNSLCDNQEFIEELIEQAEKEEAQEQPGLGTNNASKGKTLDLSNQGLNKFPMEITTDTTVTILDLSGNQLTSLVSELGKMENIEELYIQNNQLDSVVAEIRQLSKLKVLDASNNNLTGFPAEVGQLDELITLNLAGNSITALPNELFNLKDLRTLDLTDNNLSTEQLEELQQQLPKTHVIF